MARPPLGNLRGMYYDEEKNRYFPLALKPTTPGNTSTLTTPGTTNKLQGARGSGSVGGGSAGTGIGRKRGRRGGDYDVNTSTQAARRIQHSFGARRDDQTRLRVRDKLASATLCGVAELCECHGEVITSIQSFNTGGMCLTTDHGKVIWCRPDGTANSISVCSQQLLGLHCNVARATWLAVSNGSEPHVHGWRRDPQLPFAHLEPATIDFPHRDLFAMSSFDDVTTLASSKSIHTLVHNLNNNDASTLSLTRRKLPSDPLALHQASRDLVFAGLRSSYIVLEDLRTPPRQANIVASLPAGKAVVGVRRLKDSAVPWGVAVSGLCNQLLIFDMRYGRQPLLELAGHVNSYHTSLALTTTPDDTIVFAGGSDHRLRAWSTVTGEPVKPPKDHHRHNLLSMEYRFLVEHVDVAEDLTVRVAAAGDVLRFLPRGVVPGR